MKALLYLVLCFATLGSLSAREPYHTRCERKLDPNKQTEGQRQIRAYMDTVVFPRVSLSRVSFPDAIEWVRHHIAESAPASSPTEGRGISIVLKQRPGVQELFSVSLRPATLPQVLDAICKQHHYVWCVEPWALSITPREQKPPVADPTQVPNHALQRTEAGERRLFCLSCPPRQPLSLSLEALGADAC